MITAQRLQTLSTLGPTALAQVLEFSGYRNCTFKSARFLGITNGGQFCYQITYYDDNTESEETGKVFVSYSQIDDKMTADF